MSRKRKRKKVLCRVDYQRTALTIYTDRTYRSPYFPPGEYREWMLGHCDLGPIFIVKNYDNSWTTRWSSNNATEVVVAETIARAIADLEMDNILREKS